VDVYLLNENIQDYLDSDIFFIKNTIGWVLHEYIWVNPDAVREFGTKIILHPLGVRGTLK